MERFLTERSLYEKETFTIEDYKSMVVFLQGKINIDIFCPKCNEKRIYQAVPRKIKVPVKPLMVRTLIDGLDQEIYESIAAQDRREDEERFQKFIFDNRISNLSYICSKDEKHIMIFVILLENEKMMKIGQYPSYRDIDIPQADKYKSVLGKQYYSELKRAVGLYSSNVGIGSFVYLRRIIENLIKEAFDAAKKDGNLTDDDFNYSDEAKHPRRMDGKIKLLKGYLPDLMTDNASVYGIVSKGIHELTEDECMEYFPVIESGIKMILNDTVAKKERLEAEKEYQKSIGVINSKLKKSN